MGIDVASTVREVAAHLPGHEIVGDHIGFTGPHRVASSAFDVDRLLAASASVAIAGTDSVARLRGLPVPRRDVDLAHLLAYCTTHVEIDGEEVPAWADISGVYDAADGRHLQVHCNFPHHAAGVLRRLGVDEDRSAVAAAIARRDAFELETELIDDGMIAAVVRTMDEWNEHPHALATRDLPVVSVERIGEASPIADDGAGASVESLLDGVSVVDCSRVLAGPVAGQMLAGFGADVMRVGSRHLPSVNVGVMSTGFGKRNAFVELGSEAGRAELWSLLSEADVWIDAYRPGAFAAHGFTPETVVAARPGIVIVQLCAFDWAGPWAGRRGFDSIVQSTTGVRHAGGVAALTDEGAPAELGPVGLPVQALDYATGFLAAGVAAGLVAHQREVGGSWLARLSLLRTRNWLVGMGGPAPFVPSTVSVDPALLDSVDSEFGRLTAVRPFAGRWPAPPRPLGSSPPVW